MVAAAAIPGILYTRVSTEKTKGVEEFLATLEILGLKFPPPTPNPLLKSKALSTEPLAPLTREGSPKGRSLSVTHRFEAKRG